MRASLDTSSKKIYINAYIHKNTSTHKHAQAQAKCVEPRHKKQASILFARLDTTLCIQAYKHTLKNKKRQRYKKQAIMWLAALHKVKHTCTHTYVHAYEYKKR
jgi:hypothetical protein